MFLGTSPVVGTYTGEGNKPAPPLGEGRVAVANKRYAYMSV